MIFYLVIKCLNFIMLTIGEMTIVALFAYSSGILKQG
jgi:hypothetical protein